MEFIYPAKSFKEYTIGDKKLIIIGETHERDIKEQDTRTIKTWDLIKKYHDEKNYTVLLELGDDIKNFDHTKTNSLNISKIFETLGKNANMKGVDIRRSKTFFGRMTDPNFQTKFFNGLDHIKNFKLFDLIQIFDNMFVFTNKQYYGVYKNFIEKLNPDYLKKIFQMHKYIDSELNKMKSVIKNKNIKLGEFNNLDVLHAEMVNFVLLFTDLAIMIKVLTELPEKNFIMVIGYQHAYNIHNLIGRFETTKQNNKLTAKQKKLIGSEIAPNKVFVKFAI